MIILVLNDNPFF